MKGVETRCAFLFRKSYIFLPAGMLIITATTSYIDEVPVLVLFFRLFSLFSPRSLAVIHFLSLGGYALSSIVSTKGAMVFTITSNTSISDTLGGSFFLHHFSPIHYFKAEVAQKITDLKKRHSTQNM